MDFKYSDNFRDCLTSVKDDISNKDISDLIINDLDIYKHYKSKNYYMIDSDNAFWKAVFLYHSSCGWMNDTLWPNTKESIKNIPGLVSAQINFVKPNSSVPLHKDQYNGINCVTSVLCIQSNNVDFFLNNQTVILNTGDIISFDGPEQLHGLNNHSNDWFIALVIDTEI